MTIGKVESNDKIHSKKWKFTVCLHHLDFCSSSVGENEDFAAPSPLVQPTVENTKPVTNLISVDLFSDLDPRSMFKRF